jgi:FtsP/CotA-like multicopper oxidase with cupredoxin domain
MKKKTFALLGVMAFAGVTILSSCQKDEVDDVSEVALKGPSGGTVTRYPLYIPPTVTPAGFNLTANVGTTNMGSRISNSWTFNNGMPGPTLVVNSGSTASINFQNNLPEESIVHWHGLIVDHANDGHPNQAIASNTSRSYNFPVIQRAGFSWYHPHTHLKTGKQVYFGLAGGFIIRDAEESGLSLPSGSMEVPLVLRDATFNSAGNLSYSPTAGGMNGKVSLVNGTINPYLDVQKAVYRFRILNGANSRVYDLRLVNTTNNAQIPFVLIGNDGGLLPSSHLISSVVMSNGERVDILADFRNYANGTKLMLKDNRTGWSLLEFRVGNTSVAYTGSVSPTTGGQFLSVVPALPNPDTTRIFSFDGMTKINGIEYDMNRVDWTVPYGRTELWRFVTNGNAPHPVHIHGAVFQVVSRTGGRNQVYVWEQGWKDTVLLENNETVTVKIRFNDDCNRNSLYLMHCHKLEHEDGGMMANFMVVD